MVHSDKKKRNVNKEVGRQRGGRPVPVAPELFVEIGAMAVVISK